MPVIIGGWSIIVEGHEGILAIDGVSSNPPGTLSFILNIPGIGLPQMPPSLPALTWRLCRPPRAWGYWPNW